MEMKGIIANGELLERSRDPCARRCPIRDQMVCARCQHGVFHTFMSTCHLREHQCRHHKDRIELVARRPCAMLGLYFEEPRPAEAVAEPGDSDPVLEYIYSVMDADVANRHSKLLWTNWPVTGRQKFLQTKKTRGSKPRTRGRTH